MVLCGVFGLMVAVLAGCGPDEATPFPVQVTAEFATATALPPAASGEMTELSAAPNSGQIRYAVAPNAAEMVSADFGDTVRVQQLTEAVNPADVGAQYDIVVGYGDLPGGVRSAYSHTVTLILNPDSWPMMSAELLGLVRGSVDPGAVVAALDVAGVTVSEQNPAAGNLRVSLANAGWPDGIGLRMGYQPVPGSEVIVGQLRASYLVGRGVGLPADATIGSIDSSVQLALMVWARPEVRHGWVTRFGTENVIDLYTLPISYVAAEGIQVTFDAWGWPIASR
jgi:hypothetical protein